MLSLANSKPLVVLIKQKTSLAYRLRNTLTLSPSPRLNDATREGVRVGERPLFQEALRVKRRLWKHNLQHTDDTPCVDLLPL